MRYFSLFLLLLTSLNAHSFEWRDLWQTKDQQAQNKMNEEAFANAEELFQNQAWQATAAYRAEHYEKAAEYFESLKTEEGYYNQGNALAHAERYNQAVKAYRKALSLNPNHEDAKHNLELVKTLLKKQKQDKGENESEDSEESESSEEGEGAKNSEKQPDKNSDQSTQNPSKNGKEDQTKNSDRTEDFSSSKDSKGQSDLEKSPQEQKDQNEPKDQGYKDSEDNTPDETQKDHAKNPNLKDEESSKEKESLKKQSQEDPSKSPSENATSLENAQKNDALEAEDQEKHQAKEQWLRLIPDDPGGLLREKFLRDHRRRNMG